MKANIGLMPGEENMYVGYGLVNSEGRYEVRANLYGTNISGGNYIDVASNYEFKMNSENTKGYIYDNYLNKNVEIDKAFVLTDTESSDYETIDVSNYIYQESEGIDYIDLKEIYNSVTNSVPYLMQVEIDGKSITFLVESPPRDKS